MGKMPKMHPVYVRGSLGADNSDSAALKSIGEFSFSGGDGVNM